MLKVRERTINSPFCLGYKRTKEGVGQDSMMTTPSPDPELGLAGAGEIQNGNDKDGAQGSSS